MATIVTASGRHVRFKTQGTSGPIKVTVKSVSPLSNVKDEGSSQPLLRVA